MKNTQGLYFTTSGGLEYYYDDCSGLCFPSPEGLAEDLQRITKGIQLREGLKEECWGRFICSRAQAYGAFLHKDESSSTPAATDLATLETKIYTKGFRQLILVVTESCNLRCRYCIFSENYPFVRPKAGSSMSHDVAIMATRYYLDQVEQIRKRNPSHPVLITFYGGEPLLNYPLIEAVISHVRSRGVQNVTFSVSTNGLLLDDRISDYLVENDVSIAVSLDGPQSEHDRNRVTAGGEGSFSRVFSNLERFWSRHPNYPYLIFLVTYDIGTNLHEVRRFFNGDPRFRKSLFMFSQASPNFTEYYRQFSQEQLQGFRRMAREIKKNLMDSRGIYGYNDPMLDFLFGMPMYLCVKRPIFGPLGREEIPATSTCLPGDKLCVMPSGEIEVCERAPGLKIGSIENGLDFKLIKKLIDDYNRSITSHCKNCPATRLCGSCFATFWSGKTFSFPWDGFCKNRVAMAKEMLEDVWSVLEANPGYFNQSNNIDQRSFRRLKALSI